MRDEYDFSNGERGKFYRPDAELHLPHYQLTLVLETQPEGGYTLTSPTIPELITEGDSLEEVFVHLADAFAAVLEIYEDRNQPLPLAPLRQPAQAQGVTITEDSLIADLTDGRTISVPLAWYPRLVHGSSIERENWRLIGQGQGIHWPDLDEDISVENLLAGLPPGESQASRQRWLQQRPSPE